MADNATHTTCLSHTPSGQCIPVGSMTAAELKECQDRWLACYKQRVEARQERFIQAEACCADCAAAGRTHPLDRMRYHTALAQRFAAQATQHAEEAARAATRARRGNIVATAILVPLSLLVLAFSLIALLDG